jgi:hypothetical protein
VVTSWTGWIEGTQNIVITKINTKEQLATTGTEIKE